ncbi:MAG: protein-methionine-sulfoxide reductase catalytic subunit MsrP [Gammaproteobacteria bacterium]
MIIRKTQQLTEQHTTDKRLYQNRRQFIQRLGLGIAGTLLNRPGLAACDVINPGQLLKDKPNTRRQITSYNNYYEFSTNKEAVRILAQELTISPWTLTIHGEVEKPVTIDMDDLVKRFSIENRIYRLRCVEGWSMVIPWNGIPLCKILSLVTPLSSAKYVAFTSLQRSSEMIGQRRDSLDWPYQEGLRMDEALHPLTLLATGMYDDELPKQNGAPARIVVPWKYGFKSPKAITHIQLLPQQPQTSWNKSIPGEYGFYANVNPSVPHPRWSQRRENRIGELRKKPTLAFNGYADQVAHLYRGMDLKKYF